MRTITYCEKDSMLEFKDNNLIVDEFETINPNSIIFDTIRIDWLNGSLSDKDLQLRLAQLT